MTCALTTNLRRAEAPGNVLLEPGEANLRRPSIVNLRRPSIVNLSQIFTVDKAQLGGKIGTLTPAPVQQIVAGIRLLLEPRDVADV